jgi:hypothetical protein
VKREQTDAVTAWLERTAADAPSFNSALRPASAYVTAGQRADIPENLPNLGIRLNVSTPSPASNGTYGPSAVRIELRDAGDSAETATQLGWAWSSYLQHALRSARTEAMTSFIVQSATANTDEQNGLTVVVQATLQVIL